MKKILKITAISLLLLMLVSTVAFFVWAGEYYKADQKAISLLENENVEQHDRYTVISPEGEAETGIIFYPGAKVEAIAYLPILQKLADEGYLCILVEMPFNLAFFDSSAADGAYELASEIDNWYISGHSLGGGMAADYAQNNAEKIEGLILMGSYIYGDYPPEKSLTIYGTFNSNLEKGIDYTENIVVIEGGNHAQYGNYGKQDGDPDATITAEEQQDITVDAIVNFIENN